MKFFVQLGVAVAMVVGLVGCASPARKIKDVRLGMTPDEVLDVMGKPTTIRAAKVYEDGQTQQIWEYIQRFALEPRDFWIFLENDKVVQWGYPGDFAGKSGQKVPVEEYRAVRQAR